MRSGGLHFLLEIFVVNHVAGCECGVCAGAR